LSEERLRNLLVRGLAGDARAYHGFLAALGAHLRSFLRRRLARAPEEVEDLVQELLLTIHNQRHTYDPQQLLTAWVYAIARYKLIDLLRRRARIEALNDPLDDESELFAASETQAHEARYDVAALLRQLPDRQRFWTDRAMPEAMATGMTRLELRAQKRSPDPIARYRRGPDPIATISEKSLARYPDLPDHHRSAQRCARRRSPSAAAPAPRRSADRGRYRCDCG